MQDVDEEDKIFWERVFVEDDEPSWGFRDPGTAGPDAERAHLRRNKKSSSALPAISSTRNGFTRPPIFGPEKVVLDSRIKAAHQQLMNEILRLGVVAALVSYMSGPMANPNWLNLD
jgi:hypothetical protein